MAKYDLIVIGTGPAGQRAAVQAAKLGKRVAAVERGVRVGGVCLHTGTIPSKALREGALAVASLRQQADGRLSQRQLRSQAIDAVLARKEQVIRRESNIVRDQLERNDVELLAGEASFIDPHRIAITDVDGRTEHEAVRFVVAPGTRPRRPSDVPFDGVRVVDPDELLTVQRLPKTMVVVGGGVIGCEYACIFAQLGTKVTIVDRRERLLRFVDTEIVEALAFQMRNAGITLRLGEDIATISVEGGLVETILMSGKTIVAEVLVHAAGREPCTDVLSLEAAGVAVDKNGQVVVDEQYRTSAPHIFAAGDVIGFPSLASTSAEQGRIAACHAFGVPVDSVQALFPYGIYTIPEISMVGPTEEELTRNKVPYEAGHAFYREIARGQIMGVQDGVLKILFHRSTRDVLAVHAIGAGATEIIHIGQAVIGLGGKLDFFVNTVFNYPTLAECYKVAALAGLNKVATVLV
jgi:NAD(P) transhydrogenase